MYAVDAEAEVMLPHMEEIKWGRKAEWTEKKLQNRSIQECWWYRPIVIDRNLTVHSVYVVDM